MNRRGFLRGILAAGIAPYVITTAGVLMPMRKNLNEIWWAYPTPDQTGTWRKFENSVLWVGNNGMMIYPANGTFHRPYLNLREAMNKAIAGDTIVIQENHVERMTSAFPVVGGVSVRGLGSGNQRPRFIWEN